MTFLQQVAHSLRQRFGHDFSQVTIVCPNKRARLFLSEYLLKDSEQESSTPIWAPSYLTISELFNSLTPIVVADPIETVCRIYRLYVEQADVEESLDTFYGWGEKILADFDDADKNLVNVQQLFTNLADLKALDSLDYIDKRMEQAIQSFFREFSVARDSQVRQRFIQLWSALPGIYTTLNAQLKDEGMAYEGALYRHVYNELESGRLTLPDPNMTYVMVGFNVLSEVEKRLFLYLKKEQRALFYWDYDKYYLHKGSFHEAGTFIARNLELFGNELPAESFNNFRHIQHIQYVAAPTETAQAQYMSEWLREQLADPTVEERDIAVVLCNESLLQSILNTIPDEVEHINVTKGFPLGQTPAATIVESFLGSRAAANPETALDTLLNEVTTRLHEVALSEPAPERPTAAEMYKVLYAEAYFVMHTIIQRFLRLVQGGLLSVTLGTLRSLIHQVVGQTSVPFHGEPARGVQIMGLLETRSLSPRRLLLLSTNEGKLPSKLSDNSLVPYPLRENFGMTTSRHRAAVFAYYFYRLAQRAESLTCTYNASSDGLITGEKSRFLTQLEMESGLSVKYLTITNQPPPPAQLLHAIEKPNDLSERLHHLSPSAINCYLRCPKQFYYRHVRHIPEPPHEPDVIDPALFGTIFHRAAETLYQRSEADTDGRIITPDYLKSLLTDQGRRILQEHIRQAFRFAQANEDVVTIAIVTRYLQRLIKADAELGCPITILGTEKDVKSILTIKVGDQEIEVPLIGNIDRLDRITIDGTEVTRIIDYKTGTKKDTCWKEWDNLFVPSAKQSYYILQTFYYTLLMQEEMPKAQLAPALLFIQNAEKSKDPFIYHDKKRILNFAEYADEFRARLQTLVEEIYNPTLAFEPTPVTDHCRTCPYAELCKLSQQE